MSSAARQLRRLLHLLPGISDGDEHPLEQVAIRAGANVPQLVRDLQALVDRRETPGGFVEGVQIYLESGRVSVVSPHFHRPMSITRAELGALELGLAIARNAAPPDEAAPLERALERLRKLASRLPHDPDREVERHAELAAAGNPQHLSTLRDAGRRRLAVELRYRSSSADAASERRVRPYGLVYSTGAWYLVGHCEQSGAQRTFRLDRVEGATITSARFELPPDFSLEDSIGEHGIFSAERPATMRVRYSNRIARWIAERDGHQVDEDGSLTLEHPLADEAWAVRHVLQYGPDAEVLEPESLRRTIVERLNAICSS